jgi:hypothetical protein
MLFFRRSFQVLPSAPASIIVITSLSEEEDSPTPWSSSSCLSPAALIRLPLCATASGPERVSIRNGWALRAEEEPVVE